MGNLQYLSVIKGLISYMIYLLHVIYHFQGTNQDGLIYFPREYLEEQGNLKVYNKL